MSSPAQRRAARPQPEEEQRRTAGAIPQRAMQTFNLRAFRAPETPWVVESGELTATVRQTSSILGALDDRGREKSYGPVKWNLSVELSLPEEQPWRLRSVSCPTEGVRITSINTDTSAYTGVRGIELEVSAERNIREDQNRTPVRLVVEYERGGQIIRRQMDVDYTGLIGDFIIAGNEAASSARLVERYLNDPLIERLVARARAFPVGTVAEEITRLMRWIHYEYHHDPTPAVDRFGFAGGESREEYALSPTETVRYGGDCEDWNMLAGAYLVRRGFQFAMAYLPFHVFGIAVDRDGTEVAVDMTMMDFSKWPFKPKRDYMKEDLKATRIETDWVRPPEQAR